ncbi:GGDEF domain-containing protein [uncultured Erythrobacter sp.]|uniref:GGDEF domain-containing protein n=1 Tax=uncultured Erythrobacter sp. TaxID=263913 RepID=UPI00261E200F|nr:GGDEF domain-containing protein [uncultured Erythrobacter sp.]
MEMSAPPEVPEKDSPSRARDARNELLDRIREFVMKHDLNATGSNLAAITTALSGSNAALAKAFAAREISGEPIDQRWLDTVVRLDPETGQRMNELEELMDRMEYSLMRFAQTAKSAADETTEQRGALDAQLREMKRTDGDLTPQAEVDRVISLSKVMLDRLGQVEIAMERSQAESDQLRANLAKARIEADVDHLTRLPNRRAFERRLASAAQEAQLSGKPLCVAFCDVDHFKSINDTHGHDAGDRVLVTIASLLNGNASDECFVARHGGEEFVLLFYGLDADAAFNKLDGIRSAQAMKQLLNRENGKPFGKVTFSGGIATVNSIEDMRDALGRADAALYQAKENGRNQIMVI